jgi:hypothetical protein
LAFFDSSAVAPHSRGESGTLKLIFGRFTYFLGKVSAKNSDGLSRKIKAERVVLVAMLHIAMPAGLNALENSCASPIRLIYAR